MTKHELMRYGLGLLRPMAEDDPVEFLARHVQKVPSGAFEGGYDPKRWPWIAESIRLYNDPRTRVMMNLWGIQTGKTLNMRLNATWLMASAPANMVIYMDNQANAKDFSLRYLRPMFEQVEAVRSKLSAQDNPKSDIIDFADGSIVYNNSAGTEKDLQRISTRYVFGDETWQWPPNAIRQSMGRTRAFEHVSKKMYCSQGGEVGDETDQIWNMTNQMDWHFECPKCGTLQPWLWEYIRFPDSAKREDGWNLKAVEAGTTYECRSCQHRLTDDNETRRNLKGRFVAMREAEKEGWIGTHVNSLASSSWGSLAVDMIKAKEAFDNYGDSGPRMVFKQKYLALPWSEDGGAIVQSVQAGDYALADDWADEAVINRAGKDAWLATRADANDDHIPFRTMGVDMQGDHWWAVVRRWSITGHSRLMAFAKLSTWDEVEAFQNQHGVHSGLVIVDSGFQTLTVYRETAKRGWKCSKGDKYESYTVRGGQKRFYADPQAYHVPGMTAKAYLIVWSNLAGKDLLHGLRSRKVHTYGRDATQDYIEQLDAEVRRRDPKTGRAIWEMPKGVKDNHALDCELLAMLVAVRWGVVGREATAQTSEAENSQPDGQS
jgi:phage terminase large subunit GpA-like protein